MLLLIVATLLALVVPFLIIATYLIELWQERAVGRVH